MPGRKLKSERATAERTTRERILAAAVQRFSRNSYEATSLRDIAAEVGVDVAYVHRCFGSKERLFSEALRSTTHRERVFGDGIGDFTLALAGEILRKRNVDEATPLDIAVRSFSSPEASRVLGEFISDTLIRDIQSKRPEVSDQQAALVAAFVAGFGIIRDIIGVQSLQQEDDELRIKIAQVMDAIMQMH
ncbi:TetR/AcrR family transcriptional regulator [Agrobacterium sp. CNPSo 2736]|uniref:TetR/AcrR family transcriptional regulator n=1 Tax=Agrobacterium sp. CNPSo 2736 TaxID=2499627 RepID=UPI000FD8333D|nr:TetR/AcrR family transcriptional regulator [Agrobacterium sp. CNPSo 2736]RVT69804.1 TetR/AcrR family transcriptional regulator [Agrobacterium sp. CNPSo 2736]